MASLLPACAVAAWWASAWLAGRAATDDLIEVTGFGLEDLQALRASGATTVGLALPTHGDPVGLGGPGDFNAAALEAGEALVSDAGIGFVPTPRGWERHRAERRQLADVGEADRALRQGILASADALAELDVANWRPEVADEFLALGSAWTVDAPPGTPHRCVGLAVKAARCLSIADLALTDDGGAVTVWEVERRREALVPLSRAARRALIAACSPEVWPPERPGLGDD